VNNVTPVRHFPNKTGGMSLLLRTVDLTSLQRHATSPPEGTSFIANSYENPLKNTGKMPALRAFSFFVVARYAMKAGMKRFFAQKPGRKHSTMMGR